MILPFKRSKLRDLEEKKASKKEPLKKQDEHEMIIPKYTIAAQNLKRNDETKGTQEPDMIKPTVKLIPSDILKQYKVE